MDSQTLTTAPAASSPWGTCILCGRPIYTAFVILPAVRGARGRTLYRARAHVACDALAAQKLTGAELTAARAALAEAQTAIETFYAGLVAAAGQAVTP